MESGKRKMRSILGAYMEVLGMVGNGSFIDQILNENYDKPKPKLPGEDLGKGFRLMPIELTEEQKKSHHTIDMKYSHLYKDGIKISDEIFRIGGTCNGYKDEYCDLLWYQLSKQKDKNNDGFSFGLHVLVNKKGKIVFTAKDMISYPNYIGGVICKMNDKYYNLETGQVIFEHYSHGIKSTCSYFIEKDKMVYQILLKTGQIIIHV